MWTTVSKFSKSELERLPIHTQVRNVLAPGVRMTKWAHFSWNWREYEENFSQCFRSQVRKIYAQGQSRILLPEVLLGIIVVWFAFILVMWFWLKRCNFPRFQQRQSWITSIFHKVSISRFSVFQFDTAFFDSDGFRTRNSHPIFWWKTREAAFLRPDVIA